MRKTKQQLYFKPNIFKNEEVPSKLPAKSPLNFRQRKLAGQSSAVPAIRTKEKDGNPFKIQKPLSPYESPLKDRFALSEEQILNSSTYKQMQEEIMTLIKRQEVEFQKLDEIKLAKDREIKQTKDQQHHIKLEIWELRNETMELKETLQNEQEEYQKLMEELEITEEELQNHLRQADEQQGLMLEDEAQELRQNQETQTQESGQHSSSQDQMG